MQLVDKKGRLFGLINLIDLTVLVLIVVLAFGAYSKINGRLATSNQAAATQEIELDLFIKEVMDFTIDNFEPGDVLRNSTTGVVVGTVKEVNVEPFREAIADSQGNLTSRDVPELYNITLTVEGRAYVNSHGIKIQQDEILVGDVHIVQSHKSKARAVIVDVRY